MTRHRRTGAHAARITAVTTAALVAAMAFASATSPTAAPSTNHQQHPAPKAATTGAVPTPPPTRP